MDQSTITELTRSGLRSPRYSSADITAMTLQAVLHFGNLIENVAPDYFRGRRILSSNTHVFDWPSDCQRVLEVLDTKTNAVDITDRWLPDSRL